MLVLLVVFTPISADAGIFSSLLGDEAYADTDSSGNVGSTDNSQTMPLLQANVSSALIIQEKIAKQTAKKQDPKDTSDGGSLLALNSDEEVEIISDNALSPKTASPNSPLLSVDADSFYDQVSIYVVRKGDTLDQIAKMFEVSVNTIYWANDLKRGAPLKEGSTLVILPFDGLTHTVKPKDTLAGIAKIYKADVDDIAAFNGIDKKERLAVGDELIIPEGQKNEDTTKPAKKIDSKDSYDSASSRIVSGYFINPLPTGPRIRKTQGRHDKYAVDIGAPMRTEIYAAASGLVVFARTGYNGGYGNLVIIKHPNGTETRYAHMSQINTHAGKQVVQGEEIGKVGSTGRSTGPHLHFEVRGAKNPFF